MLNDKGILRNFGTLNMGKATSSDLYVETFKYHIRNGLKGINTDANNDLTNTLFSYKLAYEEGTNGYFDGNIRNQYWKSNIDGVQRAYEFSYDGDSRLTGATYAGKAGESYALNSVSYDFNGNIKTLSRNGLKSNNSFGLIDNLNYTYNANSNKILKVDDTSTEIASFKDVMGNDYTYWLDGSLKSDNNKGIDSIKYNYLKLPERIKFNTGNWINYEYDAQGTKLKKTLSTGKVTDYEEDDIYENNVLYQTSHDEGRVVNGIYEYNITDHLGNLRVAFKDSVGIAKITQVNAYGAFGDDLPTLKYINSLKINKFNFNGKEVENDFDSGFIDFKWRFSDPILGRFFTIDRLAEKFSNISTYQFASNDPINKVELDGLEGVPYFSPTQELQRKAESAYNGLANKVSSTYNSVSNSVNSALDSKSFNGAKNLTFGVLGMIGSGAYIVGTDGIGAGAGGATAFTLATGEAGIGLAQILDANSPNPGSQDLHEVGSLPGLVAQSLGSENTGLIDATSQFATGALSGGNVNGMIEAGKEIKSGKNIVSNVLNIKDAHDDTKGFISETTKSLTNYSNNNYSTKAFGQGITPPDATRVNPVNKIIQVSNK